LAQLRALRQMVTQVGLEVGLRQHVESRRANSRIAYVVKM
jgi:hypothetical protein